MARHTRSKGLTLRQKARIRAIQERRAKALESRRRSDYETVATGTMGPEEEGLVIAHFGLNVEVADHRQRRFRCAIRKTAPEEPVCGDRVIWRRAEGDQGVIIGVLERRSVLRRPTAHQRLQTLAANVERIFIVTPASDPNPGLLDRYLVAAGAASIEAVIVFNKIDHIDDADALLADFDHYRRMGYALHPVSATRGTGLTTLERALSGRLSVFVGQSGVGKSALIDHWVTGERLKIGEIHRPSGQGRHTTTTARLYPLPCGGRLIDSPGIREFGLHGVDASSIANHYRDIAPHLNQCRFSNCSHQHEPDCAVQNAVDTGEIHPARLESLFRILRTLPPEKPF